MAPQQPPPPTPAGWYPDPAGFGQRYWDGRQWTSQHVAPPPMPMLVPVQPRQVSALLILSGLVLAVAGLAIPLLAVGALVIGIVMVSRNEVAIGVLVVLLALACGLIGLAHGLHQAGY